MHYIILYNILYKTNFFLLIKAIAILPLIKSINKKKSLYKNNIKKKNLASIYEKILDKNKIIKISNIKHIIFDNKPIIFT